MFGRVIVTHRLSKYCCELHWASLSKQHEHLTLVTAHDILHPSHLFASLHFLRYITLVQGSTPSLSNASNPT